MQKQCGTDINSTLEHYSTLERKSMQCNTDELEVIMLTVISWSQTGNCLILLSEIPTVIKGD